MPEDNSNPLTDFLSALDSKGGEKGVSPPGVVKDTDGKVNPTLTSNEVTRYEKIFGIMKKVINPGPEAGKAERSTNSILKKIGGTEEMEKEKDGSGFELGSIYKLLAGLGAVGFAAGALALALTEMTEDFERKIKGIKKAVVNFTEGTGNAILSLPVMAAKFGSAVLGISKAGVKASMKAIKPIPMLGALANFWFAKDHFDKGEWFSGLWELVSGILNFIPYGAFASALMDMVKFAAELAAYTESQETGEPPKSFGQQLLKWGEQFFGWFMDKVAAGKVPLYSGLFKIGEALRCFYDKKWSEGFKTLIMVSPAMIGQGYKDSPLMKGLEWAYAIASTTASVAYEQASVMAGNAWDFMDTFFEEVGETLSAFLDGIQNWLKQTVNKGLKTATNGMVSLPGVEDKGEGGVGGLSALYNMSPTAAMVRFGQRNVQRVRNLFGLGMDDGYITKNGKVTPFNDQDDILAAKSGGPIDKMLDGNSATMRSIETINAQQLNVLVEIRNSNAQIRDSLRSKSDMSFSNASLALEFFE